MINKNIKKPRPSSVEKLIINFGSFFPSKVKGRQKPWLLLQVRLLLMKILFIEIHQKTHRNVHIKVLAELVSMTLHIVNKIINKEAPMGH